MKIRRIYTAIIMVTFSMFPFSCNLKSVDNSQVREAAGVIARVLPDRAGKFQLELVEKAGSDDVFEIEPGHGKIVIRGSSGVAICRGFNYYLKNYCHCSYNWRCGNNLNINGALPSDFKKIRKTSPYRYRYIFNYCTFSYSMAFWNWQQWEKMIDWMSMNGINMPLAPMGQELVWQRVYKKLGLNEEDLKDFFVGPAYNAFGRMGCIDGFGGPLPQSRIESENILQKKILQRERSLGMTPVLQGFTGHIPSTLVRKDPGLKFSKLKWIDFPETYLLDWQDPLFDKIAEDFISEQTSEYGTDHLYAIDQFIEMEPASGDTTYLGNMSRKIFSGINSSDPEGKWVVQTWPFRLTDFWNNDRTKAYFDAVPDDRMIALELMGEYWPLTGWHKHDGWYGKPWVWSVISNFGDNVSMFGGLTQIVENFGKALSGEGRGNLSGMGMMMEGLDYNPVTYSLISDLMWEDQVPDLREWERNYLLSRYGKLNDSIVIGWDHIFKFYYTQSGLFEVNPITKRPFLAKEDILPSQDAVSAARYLIRASNDFGNIDAFRFDLVNLFREVFGQYAGHLLYEITRSYTKRDIKEFDSSVNEFIALSEKMEKLLATREEFLFGKWIADCRKNAINKSEEKLYEWNARAIITTWGGRVLYGYAIKDWAGLYTSYYLPKWNMLFKEMRGDIVGLKKLDFDKFMKDLVAWEDNWITLHDKDNLAEPEGNSIDLARELWAAYGETMKPSLLAP